MLKGCLDAIDGMRVPMICPGKRISNSDRCFVQRKNKFAILHIELPKWSYLLGDDAFTASFHMLIPDASKSNCDNYDFEHSSNRTHIECTFRMLVNK